MGVTQVSSLAAGIEGARFASVQQSSQSANASAAQRQNSRAAEEADVKATEVVDGSSDAGATGRSNDRRLDITV